MRQQSMRIQALPIWDVKRLLKKGLTGCICGAKQGVGVVVGGLPQLQAVHLRGCDHVTDWGVAQLCLGLQHLRSLNLEYCRLVTSACLPALCSAAHLQ